MTGPAITVVVPTKDRPEALGRCLAALAAQSLPPAEVVVVDDRSADARAVARMAATAGRGRVRLVTGQGRGPAAARNLGVRTASAPVVAFTDDDCRPDPGWLAAIAAALDGDGAGGAAVVAGPTVVGEPASSATRAAQVVTNHLLEAGLDRRSGTVGFAPTCNLAARAEVLAGHPFDESFPAAAGEDRDWCDRLTAAGTAIAYVPGMLVRHHPGLDLRRFWRQQVRYGEGAHRYRAAAGGRGRPPARFYVELLAKGFRQGPSVGALVVAAQVATAVGVTQAAAAARQP
jgi:GT2 family glycosyltransferase